MQYANIIVDHRGGYEPFTYAIPAELLAHVAVGSVVLVPVGPKAVHGVIEQFVRRIDPSVAKKLKPVKAIVYEGSYVPAYLLTAARQLHTIYGFSLGETLFMLLPPLPKRRQAILATELIPTTGYRSAEYVISVATRVQFYSRMASKLAESNQSLLVVCSSLAAAHSLTHQLTATKHNVRLFPHTPKEQKEYALHATADQPTIYLGTRGAITTPLHKIGAIVIDEPWLPGQKEERSPKLWTALIAQALCKARGIPLYLASSIPWPESRLLDSPRRYVVRSLFGKVCLVPRRPLHETLTQFLADYDGKDLHLALFIRESHRQVYWCPKCKQSAIVYDKCAICSGDPIVLPQLAKKLLASEIKQLSPKAKISIFSAEEILQYEHYDAALVLGFDTFLSVVDFRATSYLVTLLYILGAQAKEVLFVTTHPDDWTRLTHKDIEHFTTTELATRKQYDLPPFAWAVTLSAKQKDMLTKLLPIKLDNVIQIGSIRQHRDSYSLPLLLKRGSKIPAEWHKKAYLKVDFLPNYIE